VAVNDCKLHYGVPYRFIGKQARVMRDNKRLLIIDPETLKPIQEYPVTWGKLPQTCPDQWYVQQPEELPTTPVSVSIRRIEPQEQQSLFSRYDVSDGGGKNVH